MKKASKAPRTHGDSFTGQRTERLAQTPFHGDTNQRRGGGECRTAVPRPSVIRGHEAWGACSEGNAEPRPEALGAGVAPGPRHPQWVRSTVRRARIVYPARACALDGEAGIKDGRTPPYRFPTWYAASSKSRARFKRSFTSQERMSFSARALISSSIRLSS